MLLDINMSVWYSWFICIILLIVGIFLLVKFSDLFVAGASSLAKKLKISPLIIGLTVVAFGTSCPELAVSVSDSITCLVSGGNANVAMGNIVGSNICNLLIVLGFSAIFTPIVIKKGIIKKEYPILIGVSFIFTIFTLCFCLNIDGTKTYAILRWEGIILIFGIIGYVTYLVISSKNNKEENAEEIEELTTLKSILYVILGAVGVVLGGEAVVYGAKNIAYGIGDLASLNKDLVESLVGLTIVAIGTSLPELVTSIVAAKKGQNEIALGNVIGSNIFNILFVIGISSTVNPITVGNQIWVDLLVMMVSTLLVFGFSLKGKITKSNGIILLICYVLYLIYLLVRTITGTNYLSIIIILISIYTCILIYAYVSSVLNKYKDKNLL